MSEAACQVCGRRELLEVPEFSALPRVSSDCKPWPGGGRLGVCAHCGAIQKFCDAAWRDEIDRIYGDFQLYHQSQGAEQSLFDTTGKIAPRSVRLVEHLSRSLTLGETGSLLDMGCGNGATLRSFAARFPRWRLYGTEFDEKWLAELRRIPGFTTLFCGETRDIATHFDLVTMVHSFEHFIEPVGVLSDLAPLVGREGAVFIQVPDCARSPYDLVITDHLLHLTLATLRLAVARAGYATLHLSDSVVQKELSWTGRVGDAALPTDLDPADLDPPGALDLARRNVAWLTEQARRFPHIAGQHGGVGIFGTANSATWLYGMIADRVAFFVDEDPARVGSRHLGLPIIAPSEIGEAAHVLVPLVPSVAKSVAARCARPGIEYHLPTDFPAA